MPRKPKRPCSHPGCPKLTDGRFCEEHEQKENKRYEKYDRSPEIKQRYGKQWRAIRKAYVAKHPLCEECLHDGRLTKTEEVHHIKPLAYGGTHDEDNLMALCKRCHSRITAAMGDRWKKKTRP